MRLALVSIALLTGCATPLTVGDIEGAKGARAEITVAAAPAVTHRRLAERARECLQMGELQVQSDFYPDISTGRVSLVQSSIGWTMATARIEPAAGGSRVRVSTYDPGGSGKLGTFGQQFLPWARGEPGDCTAEKFKPRPESDRSRQ